jgi:hypothetical protein
VALTRLETAQGGTVDIGNFETLGEGVFALCNVRMKFGQAGELGVIDPLIGHGEQVNITALWPKVACHQ